MRPGIVSFRFLAGLAGGAALLVAAGALLFPMFSTSCGRSRSEARDTAAIPDLAAIYRALEQYRNTGYDYPLPVPRYSIPTARGLVDLADLRPGSILEGAGLPGAAWRGVRLVGVTLRDCYLEGADLRNADLRGAVFERCELGDADLSGADLRGADLRTSNPYLWPETEPCRTLSRYVRLEGALFDRATRWPPYFTPDGARRAE